MNIPKDLTEYTSVPKSRIYCPYHWASRACSTWNKGLSRIFLHTCPRGNKNKNVMYNKFIIVSYGTEATSISIMSKTPQCGSHNHVPGLTRPHRYILCSLNCVRYFLMPNASRITPQTHWLNGHIRNKCHVDLISLWHRTHKSSIGQWCLMRFSLVNMASLATNHMKAFTFDGVGVFQITSDPDILVPPFLRTLKVDATENSPEGSPRQVLQSCPWDINTPESATTRQSSWSSATVIACEILQYEGCNVYCVRNQPQQQIYSLSHQRD